MSSACPPAPRWIEKNPCQVPGLLQVGQETKTRLTLDHEINSDLGVSKNRVEKTPKMDGENNGKPY